MIYLIAIVIGSIAAYFSNFILDYLPQGRVVENRKMRKVKPKGAGASSPLSIKTQKRINHRSLFIDIKFPYCFSCKDEKSWKDYFLMRKCDACGSVVRKRTWILLFGMPAAFLALMLNPVEGLRIADLFVLLTYYIIVFVMDMEHRVILYPVTIAGIIFGFYFGLSYHNLISTVIGGVAGGGIMLLFYWIGILYIQFVRRTSNPNMNEVALGFGDVTLSLVLGFILGWPGILGGLFFGILLGGVISGGLLLIKFVTKKYAPNDLILPYAPFLIIGAFIIMIL